MTRGRDPIFRSFLERQYEDGNEFTETSKRVELVPLHGSPPSRYLVRFDAKGLVRHGASEPQEATSFTMGLYFHDGYLRRTNPGRVLTWLSPVEVFHPNIAAPFICIGPVAPGTGLVDLLYRVYEVITFHNVSPREDDALNRAACAWARQNRRLFPLDRRPFKSLT
ncbi:MAG: hypothetical protein E2P02_05115 [Acidobacteria bacterium]|nr:MAG: hypothetical protein E2P02_05115 [Acidobacteriota bacterium]